MAGPREDEMTIEELCRPPSARLMPQRSLWTCSHTLRTQEDALHRQRVECAAARGRRSLKRKSEQ